MSTWLITYYMRTVSWSTQLRKDDKEEELRSYRVILHKKEDKRLDLKEKSLDRSQWNLTSEDALKLLKYRLHNKTIRSYIYLLLRSSDVTTYQTHSYLSQNLQFQPFNINTEFEIFKFHLVESQRKRLRIPDLAFTHIWNSMPLITILSSCVSLL